MLWKVEVSTCLPAVYTLVPELMGGNGHGCKSSSLPCLDGEASLLESLSSKHTLERLIFRLEIESPVWPFYMALKPLTAGVVSVLL